MNDTIESLARKLIAPLRQYFLSYNFNYDGTTLVNTGGNIMADGHARIGTHATYGSTLSGFWRNGSDYAVLTDGTNTYLNAASGASLVLRIANQTRVTVDATTNVWQTPTLVNGWVNYGSPYTSAGYTKDSNGVVHLRGLVKSGATTTGTVIFTLPAGYRPTSDWIFALVANDLLGQCRVDTSGNVKYWTGSNFWFSLDGISFAAF